MSIKMIGRIISNRKGGQHKKGVIIILTVCSLLTRTIP